MKDLGELLFRAKDKKIYKDIFEFKELINKIKEIDNGLELDWDTGAGEDWVQFVKKGVAIVCMLHTKIGIAFIRRDLIDSKTLELLQPLFVVYFYDYESEEWCIDLNLLKEKVPEIEWLVTKDAVNDKRMSLLDLYFATV